MSITLETKHTAARSLTGRLLRTSRRQRWPGYIDPDRLSIHLDALYRAARAMCASQPDAEDLVQDALANVLRRPRLLRNGNELGYLLRAQNSYSSRYRPAQRWPQTLLGMSYREAVHSLGRSEATLTTRIHRGCQRVASQLVTETTTAR